MKNMWTLWKWQLPRCWGHVNFTQNVLNFVPAFPYQLIVFLFATEWKTAKLETLLYIYAVEQSGMLSRNRVIIFTFVGLRCQLQKRKGIHFGTADLLTTKTLHSVASVRKRTIPNLANTAVINSDYNAFFLSLWLYSPLALGHFFTFLILYTVGTTPLMGDQPVARQRYLHAGQHKHRRKTHRHPCLEWDSYPRPQRSSGRRRFMP
jgi:hypothetical protein